MTQISNYLEIVTLNDEVSILVPLDLGLGFAVDLTLKFNVPLDHSHLILGSLLEPRFNLDLEKRCRVQRVLRVLGTTLVKALVTNRKVLDLQGPSSNLGEPGVQVTEVHSLSIFEPGDGRRWAGVCGAIQSDGGALLRLLVAGPSDKVRGARLVGGIWKMRREK